MNQSIDVFIAKLSAPVEVLNIDRRACHLSRRARVCTVAEVLLRTLLKKHSDYLSFKPGEQIDGNEGYTMIYPRLPLPPFSEIISGKSEEKILKEFRLYGDTAAKKAIQLLTRSGKLRSRDKGKIKAYETSNI